MDKWLGKVAVVTGASSGIGREVAKSLAEKGMIVVGLARRIEMVEDLAAKVDGKIHPVKCDLTNEEDILEAFRTIEKKFGGVDVLINNAGVSKVSRMTDGSTEDWMTILKTNVLALSICTREALKSMKKRGNNGQIIHINSVLGHYFAQFDNMPLGMYNASKFGVTALTEALRIELQQEKSNIKVSSISPGIVQTEILNKALEGSHLPQGSLDSVPSLDVGDISQAVVYVLSTGPKVQIQDIIIQAIGAKMWS